MMEGVLRHKFVVDFRTEHIYFNANYMAISF